MLLLRISFAARATRLSEELEAVDEFNRRVVKLVEIQGRKSPSLKQNDRDADVCFSGQRSTWIIPPGA
jgi:hypothetical protein